ncbi:hypothetical protein Zmor_025789 [Zophobas morio]|uniref:Rotatin n=1 Tax=Zophobas morio TaxID=2755281 RepID=A0AA38HT20_9CUCU|nr:hypothetical protein Zmor_025789 [Zophobas morio]
MPKVINISELDHDFICAGFCRVIAVVQFPVNSLVFVPIVALMTDTHLPQLIYLRNRVWSEIFKLLSALTTFETQTELSDEALRILSQTIEDSGREAFIETVCEATKSLAFNDLQNSALLSLTSLLSVESQQIFKKPPSTRDSSMQNLLDTVRTVSTTPETDRSDDSVIIVTETVAGAELCKILLNLYDLCNLKVSKDLLRKKSVITSSLTSILCVSHEAKKYALKAGLPTATIKQMKEFYVKLSLESVDCLRRVLEKKRVCPVLKELNELVGLVTNFMVGDGAVKNKFAELGLSDFVHKLWVWFALQNSHLVDVLRMLCTFTTDCAIACQSLPLTSSVAGSGPRKIPSKISLLNVVIGLVEKEMDQVSKTHNLGVLKLCFGILTNCCSVLECRIIISKSTLLTSVSRLHPAITKKQKPWDLVELLWLEFLQTFTLYPEGQSSVAKINDVFDLLLALTSASKVTNRSQALTVLRNVAFYQPNRTRLLTSDDFLNLLKNKLEYGNKEEKSMVVLIMWSLAANNQKAKIVFKAAKLDAQLHQVLKHYQLSSEMIPGDDIDTIKYVLNVIRDGERDS